MPLLEPYLLVGGALKGETKAKAFEKKFKKFSKKKKKKKLFKFVLEESEAIEQHLSRWFEGSQHSEGHCVGIM